MVDLYRLVHLKLISAWYDSCHTWHLLLRSIGHCTNRHWQHLLYAASQLPPAKCKRAGGNLTRCGSHRCCDERVMWLHVCSSSSVRVRVSAILLVPWTASGNTKSPSSVIMYRGASLYGLSWTLIPKWLIWLGLTKVWSILSLIHNPLLKTSM